MGISWRDLLFESQNIKEVNVYNKQVFRGQERRKERRQTGFSLF